MASGTVALSQEPVPTKQEVVLALGRYAPGTTANNATFALATIGPDFPLRIFSYNYPTANLNLVSTSVSHVSFVGQAAVVRGAAKVNRVGGYTFTATLGRGSEKSIGLEIRYSDGTVYF